jgi:hypothetical protein
VLKSIGTVSLLRLPPNSPFALMNLVLSAVKVPATGVSGGHVHRHGSADGGGGGDRGGDQGGADARFDRSARCPDG